jgi:cytochrome c553
MIVAACVDANLAWAQSAPSILHAERASPGDLEVTGELVGAPSGAIRYVRYEDLLKLKQVAYTVNDDTNLARGAMIEGVPLIDLAKLVAENPRNALISATCDDDYQAHYPAAYVVAHQPILVLRVSGKLRDQWPKSNEGDPLGPYFISHPIFKPMWKVLSYEDEAQVPYGVIRLDLRKEQAAYVAIRPGSRWRENADVQSGYRIASQDCLRCHNMGALGGTKAERSWTKLARMAQGNPERFEKTIREPASVTKGAMMPAHSNFDDATLNALTAYFATFASADSHTEKKPSP